MADLLAGVLDKVTPAMSTTAERPVAVVAQSAVVPRDTAASPASAPQMATPGDSLVVAAAEGALVSADTVEWTPAVARTWVNVRYDASKGSDVVGVIKPSEKAMLGEYGRGGWRQVKSPEVSGWVDPRNFEADSLRSRG